jgi:pimeloyl-ACP methyl ester carboxylesterase
MNCRVAVFGLGLILLAGCRSGEIRGNWCDVSRAEVKTVQVDDVELAYKVFGRGEPLVMITGYGATMDAWSPKLVETLAERYRVIVFDNRGMGLSTASAKEFTVPLMAEDTAGLMAALGIEKAHVMGWSMGSTIAQELALRHPEKVNKLILYATDYENKDVLAVLNKPNGGEHENHLIPKQWLANHPDPAAYMPEVTEKADPAIIQRQLEAISNWSGTYDRLVGLKNDLLIIAGSDDAVTRAAKSLVVAGQVRGAWLVQFKNGGHGLMYQASEDMAAVVLTFLAVRENLE